VTLQPPRELDTLAVYRMPAMRPATYALPIMLRHTR
jgi:hypothetical protein